MFTSPGGAVTPGGLGGTRPGGPVAPEGHGFSLDMPRPTAVTVTGPSAMDLANLSETDRRIAMTLMAAVRDMFGDTPSFRVRQTNGYFAKFAPMGAALVRISFSYGNVLAPGVDQAVVIGGFRVPDQMKLQVRTMSFAANRSGGGMQVPIEGGQLNQYLAFGLLDNDREIGVQASMESLGAVALGPLQFDPASIPAPPFANAQKLGVGSAMAPDHAYYVGSGENFAIIGEVVAALPYPITSMTAVMDGMLLDRNIMDDRLMP